MIDLRMNLDDTDFERLVELGRSIIPTVAPAWTDHNIHDPGIMLVELLAWIADAQIYSLSRMRRDERLAYARLFGVRLRGPHSACGLVWPDVGVGSDAPTRLPWADGMVVATDKPITPDAPDAPVFYATHTIQLTSAQLTDLSTRFADGRHLDWTRANKQDGATFKPFGDTPAPGDRLVLQFQGPLVAKSTDRHALIAIGVEIVGEEPGHDVAPDEENGIVCAPIRLRVAIEDSAGERPIELATDTTDGLSRSGVLLLRVPADLPIDEKCSITIRSATGAFLRPPRVQRIAPNVLLVRQLESVFESKEKFGTGMPDQVYVLERKGLVFPIDPESFTVRMDERGDPPRWSFVADLQTCGPNDYSYTLDPIAGTLHFGNGVNGAIPPRGADLSVQYQVSQGARGNLPKGIKWSVHGIGGVFGGNSEPTLGGVDRRDLDALQGIARRRRECRPYVTANDLMVAARSFADLGVKRALELLPGATPGHRVRGTRTLVVVGAHDPEADSADAVESAEWIEEIRARLAPRVPLGERLTVMTPRYVDVRVTAKLVAAPNVNPEAVRRAAEAKLREQLAIVARRTGDPEWPFGRDIAPLELKGWLRNVDGVASVTEMRLLADGRDTAGEAIRLSPIGLPRLQHDPSDIEVERWSRGGTR